MKSRFYERDSVFIYKVYVKYAPEKFRKDLIYDRETLTKYRKENVYDKKREPALSLRAWKKKKDCQCSLRINRTDVFLRNIPPL